MYIFKYRLCVGFLRFMRNGESEAELSSADQIQEV